MAARAAPGKKPTAAKRTVRKEAEPKAPSNWEPAAAPPRDPAAEANQWAMFAHLAALSKFIGVPFGGILGPLVVWLIKRKEMPAVDHHGKESLNFQITVAIVSVAFVVVAFVFFAAGFVGGAATLNPFALIAAQVPLLLGVLALLAFDVVMVAMGAIKANQGVAWRYPISLRFVK